jgi:large subunit ribosomal protein L18
VAILSTLPASSQKTHLGVTTEFQTATCSRLVSPLASSIRKLAQKVLASASTVETEVRNQLAGQSGGGGNTAAAALVGKRIAEKALAAGIQSVAFDRSGFRFHGRVKTLADAAREAGLKF